MTNACKYKVLVSTIPCWNDNTGSNTFSSLFEGYDLDKIANLYLREEIPESPICKIYFRISENLLIRSLFNKKIKSGKLYLDNNIIADEQDTKNFIETQKRYKKHSKNRRWLLLYAREVLWKLGRWKSTELDSFVDSFKPDVIIFAMEGYIHFNRINRYIIKRSGAKAIGYFWDDNFTYKQKPWNIGYRIYRFFQRRDLIKTAKCCEYFFAISPKTKTECDAFFGINSMLLTKPVNIENDNWKNYELKTPIKMLYTGKLLIGRWQTIKLLNDAMSKINREKTIIELDIYTTSDIPQDNLNKLNKSIRILGNIPQSEVLNVQQNADILLFIEDLIGKERKTARLSFSTKLTDYFRSGKCIFAIGDNDLSSIEYLKEKEAAVIATNTDEIESKLRLLCDNPHIIKEYGKKAFQCGKYNHNQKDIKSVLFETINKLGNRREG